MANVIYNDIVLGNKFESILMTKLDLAQFLTTDDSLTQESGMTKKIVTKSARGQVDKVAMGEGNTHFIECTTDSRDYTVGTTQGQAKYHDEEAMSDAHCVDACLEGLAEEMVNDFTRDAVAEFEKASLQVGYAASAGYGFDEVVDAIALMNMEAEEGLFGLICPKDKAKFRKKFKDDLKYVEAFIRTGYIGSVCGVPFYISKAIPEGECFIGTREAITNFVKKGSEVEQKRDPDTRTNYVIARKVNVIALTDARKLVKIGANQATDATITTYTKNAKTVAGAATTGATVEVYINGKLDGTCEASSSAYSYTAKENLAAGDEVKVVAHLTGCIDSSAEVEVAA